MVQSIIKQKSLYIFQNSSHFTFKIYEFYNTYVKYTSIKKKKIIPFSFISSINQDFHKTSLLEVKLTVLPQQSASEVDPSLTPTLWIHAFL